MTLKGNYRKIFSSYTESGNNNLADFEWNRENIGKEKMYDWDLWVLYPENVVHKLFTTLKEKMSVSFTKEFETAAMMGL